MIAENDLRIDTGRAEGGTFVRIVHVPTGISRVQMPPLGGGKAQRQTRARLLREIEQELRARGLLEFLLEP